MESGQSDKPSCSKPAVETLIQDAVTVNAENVTVVQYLFNSDILIQEIPREEPNIEDNVYSVEDDSDLSQGKELPLFQKIEDSFELDENVLKSVLMHPRIGDRPISIVSIAGAFKTGKSFILNFFLRYLRNKGYENENWLIDYSTSVNDGIQWRGGLDTCTNGINIWSEPFIVKKGSEEIAVILLDTQGNSDFTQSQKSEVNIFVVSTLLSSTLIYNVKNKLLNSKDLEYLQFFTEHAKDKNLKQKKSSFQSIMVLMRDWDLSKQYAFGKQGGEDYLKFILETKCSRKLQNYLSEAFESFACYLMPNPGKTVRQAENESDISLKDIKPAFIEHIKLLTTCLLKPECLIAKRIGGDLADGKWLVEYIAQCWNRLKMGDSFESETMMEMSGRSKCQLHLEKAIKICKKEIQKIHTSYLLPNEIDAIKVKSQKAALSFYDDHATYGGKDIIQTYRQKLEVDIDRELVTLNVENEIFEVKLKQRLQDAVTKCYRHYRNELFQHLGKTLVKSGELKEIDKTYSDEAMNSFSTLSSDIKCQQMVDQFKEKLTKKLTQLFLEYEKRNTEQNFAAQRCYEEEYQMREEFDILCNKEFNEKKYVEEENLQKFMNSTMKTLIEGYIKERMVMATEQMKSLFRENFRKALKEEAKEIQNVNIDRKFVYGLHLKSELARIKLHYIQSMENKLADAYINPSVLEEYHEKIKEEVLDRLETERRDLEVFKKHEEQVKKELVSLYKIIHGWNEENKPFRRKVKDALKSGAWNVKSMITNWFRKQKTDAASQVSSGMIGPSGGVLGNNDCAMKVPLKAVFNNVDLQLTTSFENEEWKNGYLAITPTFRCGPSFHFEKKIEIKIPTWCSATIDDDLKMIVYSEGDSQVEKNFVELNEIQRSDNVLRFETNHFLQVSCHVHKSQIVNCTIALLCHVYTYGKHHIVVIFHLDDKSVQNTCEVAMEKEGLHLVFCEKQSIKKKYGEAVKISLQLLGDYPLGDEHSLTFNVDEAFVLKGFIWKKIYFPGIEISNNMQLTYDLNTVKTVNLQL